MHHAHEHRFPDAAALARALAGEIQVDLQEAIAARGHASLVVSGGRTPVTLFNQLAQEKLPWDKVWVTLADERWVDAHDAASNERLVRAELLRQRAEAAQFIGLKNAAATPEAGVEWAWRSLSRIARPFDVVLLGMGDDGHTASLFPGSPHLSQALNTSLPPAVVAMQAPVEPSARISLNLNALLDARRIIVHIQGESKWALYQSAKAHGPVAALPVRAVLHQQIVPVEVFWSP
ncbi:MAG: 6-phosphogluconolactonase [Steroidobacteraceae bacterium]